MFTILGADGREYGPADVDQVKAWISDGRASLDTKAKKAGDDTWRRLGDFPEFGAGAAVPPAAVPPMAVPPQQAGAATVPFDPKVYADDLIARAKPLDVFSCLERGWQLVKTRFWPTVGACTIVLLIVGVAGRIPVLGWIANFVFQGALYGGLAYFILKLIRGHQGDIGDIFAGFKLALVPLMVAGMLTTLLTALGLVLLILPGIYLAVAYTFVYAVAIDKKLDFWPAMEVSRRVVTAQWWRVFLLLLLCIIVAVLGLLGLIIGVFITGAIATAAVLHAYEDLFNPPPKA